MTTITRIKARVSADLPVLTDAYGIIDDPQMGMFLRRLEQAGHTLTDTQLGALRDFFDTGRESGWIGKILYLLPFTGTAPEHAAIPMVDRFHAHAPLTNTGTADPIPADALTMTEAGYIAGTKPWAAGKCLAAPLTAADLFHKTPQSANRRNGNYGIIWIGRVTSRDGSKIARIAGAATSSAAENYLGLGTQGEYLRKCMGREIKSDTAGATIAQGDVSTLTEHVGHFYATSRNIFRYAVRKQLADTPAFNDETAARPDCATLHDTAAEERWGINASFNAAAGTATFSDTSVGLETRLIAWTDGTLDETDTASMLPVLRKLLAALGKI